MLLIVILAYAAFLRLYRFQEAPPPALNFDEAMNGCDVLEILETHHFQIFYPENNGREGLYIDMVTPLVALLGNEVWVLRLPAAAFGILTVWAVYLLTAELFSIEEGLLAAFFIATSFWHINFSRIAFRAILSPFLLTLSLYLLVTAFARLREGNPHLRRAISAGLVYGLGFHTYIAYRSTPLLVAGLLVYWYFQARNGKWLASWRRGTAAFVVAATVVVLPLAIYFLLHPAAFLGRAEQVSILNTQHPFGELVHSVWLTVGMFFFKGDANWLHNVSGRPQVFWPVAIFFAVGVVLAARRVFRGNGFSSAVILGWLLVAGGTTALSAEGMPHALRSIIMIPPVFILAGVAARQVIVFAGLKLPHGMAVTAALVYAAALCYEPFHTYFELWSTNPALNERFCTACTALTREVLALPRTRPKYIVVAERLAPIRGIPIGAASIMYLSNTYTKRGQEELNLHYIGLPADMSGFDPKKYCLQQKLALPDQIVYCLY